MPSIYVKNNNKKIFTLSINNAKKSIYGEFDIMLHSGQGMIFDTVVAGNYFCLFKNEVNAVSWHGFYEEVQSGKRLMPSVNFKYRNIKKGTIRHFGTINFNEPIPVPICSLYVPNKSCSGNSSPCGKNNLDINIDEYSAESDVRVDFFVFGKGVSPDRIKESPAEMIFTNQKIDVFNNGGDLSSPEENLSHFYSKLGDDRNVLVRVSIDPKDMFTDIKGSYSLLIHEPNDFYNIINRLIVELDENGKPKSPKNIREVHESKVKGDVN